MTKEELSNLYHLNCEIERQQKRLEELQNAATSCSASISGMPSGSGISDKVSLFGTEIADLENLIVLSIQKCWKELNSLNRYINSIPDSQTREIFRLRYVNGMSWQQVAFTIGEHDEQVPRRKHNAFLKKSNWTKMTN